MKIKLLTTGIASFVLAVSSLFALAPSLSALADSCDWTGGGGNTNFSNVSNWSCTTGGTAPGDDAGDSVTINAGSDVNIVFDAATTSPIVSITVTGTGNVNITGSNAISIATSVVNSGTGTLTIGAPVAPTSDPSSFVLNAGTGSSISISGVISGDRALEKTGPGVLNLSGVNIYTAGTTVTAGSLLVSGSNGLGGTSAGTTVATGATIVFQVEGAASAVAEPLVLTGAALTDRDKVEINKGAGEASEFTLSGAITLNNDVTLSANRPVVVSGVVSGAGGLAFTPLGSSTEGSLKLTGTNTFTGATTVSDEMIITGSQSGSAVTVSNTGTLKGTGTVGALTVNAGGHLAPGLSPGCLISGNTTIAGNFDIELGGTTACTQYDQLQVTGTVDVTGGTLNVSRFGGFTPAVGQTFTIISNDVADAVTGTFAGLAQGATITVDGYTFIISYTGGDGNDVVLTVTGVPATATPPAAPNTGFGLIMANPLLTFALTTGAAAALFIASRRYGLITISNRK